MEKTLEYYGVIDSVEVVNSEQKNWYYVLVDCIEAKGLEDKFLNQTNDEKLINVIDTLTLELLLVKIPFEIEDSSFNFNKFNEGRWLKIFSSNQKSEIKTEKLSSYYNDSDSTFESELLFNFLKDQTEGINYNYEPIDGRTSLSRRLRDANDLEKAAIDCVNQDKAKRLLSSISISKEGERFATCYNVGQGSAVCVSEKLAEITKPLLYFDVGGGANFNRFTYPDPDTKNFKVEENTIFILSHWDEDHYETAKRNMNLVRCRKYIAPVQIVTPRNLLFAKKIKDNGELILLPKKFTEYVFSLGTLVRCKEQDLKKKNDSGLALLLDLNKKNNLNTILLPGDAQYKFIPNIKDIKIDALIATHHGGKLNRAIRVPSPTNKKGCIAYSYGKDNIYGHPLRNSECNHTINQWGTSMRPPVITRLDTKDGDILFSYINNGSISCAEKNEKDLTNQFINTCLNINFIINKIINE